MVIWLTKINGKLRITDKEVFSRSDREPVTIGHLKFVFELNELLIGSEKEFIQWISLREGQSTKMVLKQWPIE